MAEFFMEHNLALGSILSKQHDRRVYTWEKHGDTVRYHHGVNLEIYDCLNKHNNTVINWWNNWFETNQLLEP